MFIPEQDAKTYERLAIGNAAIAGVCLVLLLLLPLVDAYLAAFMMLLAPAWLGGVAVAIISGHLALAKLWHMPGLGRSLSVVVLGVAYGQVGLLPLVIGYVSNPRW